jgi:hypothetical protein
LIDALIWRIIQSKEKTNIFDQSTLVKAHNSGGIKTQNIKIQTLNF